MRRAPLVLLVVLVALATQRGAAQAASAAAATAAAASAAPPTAAGAAAAAATAATISASAPQTAAAAAPPPPPYAYIAFVNDVHDRLEEEEPLTATPCSPKTKAEGRCVGGWPRISSMVNALRQQAAKERAAFFFLDAGDEFTGSLWFTAYKGQTVLPAVQNLVRVDAQTLGNHEYDPGVELLGSYIKQVKHPMLACNIDVSAEPALRGLVRKYVVLTSNATGTPIKVGVVGWITPDTAVTANSVGKVTFAPVAMAVPACIEQLKKEHKDLDLIVGLSHTGYEADLQAAKTLPDLDVIVGGHSHTFLYTPTAAGPIVTRKPGVNASNCVQMAACDKPAGPYPTFVNHTKSGKAVPVVQAYYSSKYLGLIKVNLRTRTLVLGVQPLLLGGANSSSNVQPDPKVLDILTKFRAPVAKLETQVTGRTSVPLEGDPLISRVNETNMGNFVCEAFLAAVPAAVAAKVPGGRISICLMNAGGIRSGLPEPGNITVGTVLSMLPYANANAIFTVSGAAIAAALKNGLSAYPNGGRFLQVSGLRYFHRNGTFLSVSLLSDNSTATPLDPARQYPIVATDYMLQGGDGFNFSGASVVLPAGEPYAQLVMDRMKATLPGAIAPTTHDRIINCATKPSFPGCPPAAAAAAGGKQPAKAGSKRRR